LNVPNVERICATKRLNLHRTPRALQLHLKRFGISEGGGSTKIVHHVTFPESLTMDPFTSQGEDHLDNPLDYALYAVIVHIRLLVRIRHYVT